MRQPALAKVIKNDQWIDKENESADPEILPHIPGFHILVRPCSIKNKTKGGIFIPDSTQEDMAYLTTVGRVIIIGDLAYGDSSRFPNGPWCQEGDYVCYGKHSGNKLFYQGKRFILLFDDQILMTIDSPHHLDPTYDLSN